MKRWQCFIKKSCFFGPPCIFAKNLIRPARCPIVVHKKYLYIYARANCASRSLNFVNKNKNTRVSDNNPFAGKRMGRHINIKLLS